jgi:hypothetical protein
MNAKKRAAANRRNSALSTGPVTNQGKRRASLNALRHGLTGQSIVLPTDDLAAYRESCREFHAELKPAGLLEIKAVQTIADTHWRLDRIRAMEHNLFSLGLQEQSTNIAYDDPAIHSALAQAKAVQSNADTLARLSLYEQRLNRTLTLAKAELKQLQQERRTAEEHALSEAAPICKLKEALGQPWKPEDDGFEFSSSHLFAWIHRAELTQQADHFKYRGQLPSRETLSESRPANPPLGSIGTPPSALPPVQE